MNKNLDKLREDYVTGRGSLRELADVYGQPLATVLRRSSKEQWVIMKHEFEDLFNRQLKQEMNRRLLESCKENIRSNALEDLTNTLVSIMSLTLAEETDIRKKELLVGLFANLITNAAMLGELK